jgi:hypothetical protein
LPKRTVGGVDLLCPELAHSEEHAKQPFRIIATLSQNFSFLLRDPADAESCNQILLSHLAPELAEI